MTLFYRIGGRIAAERAALEEDLRSPQAYGLSPRRHARNGIEFSHSGLASRALGQKLGCEGVVELAASHLLLVFGERGSRHDEYSVRVEVIFCNLLFERRIVCGGVRR